MYYIQCPPLILAPLVNMSKGGCENKSALFILFIFHSKNVTLNVFFYLLLSSTKLTVESANNIILLFKKEFSSQDSNICSSVSGQIELIQ